MEKHWVEEIFEECGAILNGHFVLASGRHSGKYLEKALIYVDPERVSDLCYEMAAEASRIKNIEAVVGPAMGGISLSQWIAYYLSDLYQRKVLSLFTEKNKAKKQVLKRGYQKLVAGKQVLVVDDILTTGGSVKQVIKEVVKAGGEVAAVCVTCNRGGVTSEKLGYPLFWLWKADIESWTPEECPSKKHPTYSIY